MQPPLPAVAAAAFVTVSLQPPAARCKKKNTTETTQQETYDQNKTFTILLFHLVRHLLPWPSLQPNLAAFAVAGSATDSTAATN